MRLLAGSLRGYAIPLTGRFRTAAGGPRVRKGLLLKLRSVARHDGLGEAAPLPGRTESLGKAKDVLGHFLLEILRGSRLRAEEALGASGRRAAAQAFAGLEDFWTAEDFWAAGAFAPLRESPAARAAATCAFLDLRAQEEGKPLATWLAARFRGGGEAARWVPLNATLPLAPVRETVEAARAATDAAFPCLKLKVGRDDADDVARTLAVREAVGPGVSLRLDANGAWSFERAARVLRAISDAGVEYVEQPLPPAALEEAAALRRETPVPIAADEAVRDADSVRRLVEAGAADVLVLKPTVLGGPDAALALAAMAEEAGLGIVVTSALEGVTGRLAALHTAAALGPGVRPCGLATGRFLAREVAEGCERILDGRIRVPDEPGLGAQLPFDLEETPGRAPDAPGEAGRGED